MAIIERTKTTVSPSAATSLTPDLPAHVTDDLLLVIASLADFGETLSTVTSGWTAETQESSFPTVRLFWKIATSSSEPAPVIDSTKNDDWIITVATISGVDATTPIPESSFVYISSSDDDVLNPTLTTSTANTLVLEVWACQNGNRILQAFPSAKFVSQTDATAQSLTLSSYYMPSTGTSTANRATSITTTLAALFSVSIQDDGNGNIEGTVDNSVKPVTVVHRLAQVSGTSYSGDLQDSGENQTDPTGLITTLDGTATQNVNWSSFNIPLLEWSSVGTSTSNITLAGQLNAPCLSQTKLATAQDFTGKILSLTIFASDNVLANIDVGSHYFGLSSGTNAGARVWRLEAGDTIVRGAAGYVTIQIDIGNSSDFTDFNTFDITDVQRLVFGSSNFKSGQSRRGWLHQLETMVIIGGSAANPANFSTCTDFASMGSMRTVQNQLKQTDGQYYCTQNIQIGNGSDTTYWDSSNQSVSFPQAYDFDAMSIHSNVPTGSYTLSVIASSTDTIILSFIANGGNFNKFLFDPTTSTSATYVTTGTIFIDKDVELDDLGVAFGGISFTGCKEIVMNDADASVGCVANNCSDANVVTVTGGSEAAVQIKLDALDNWTFTDNTNAVNVDFATSLELTSTTQTFSGNTADVRYTGGDDAISGATQADPVVITSTGHSFSNGDRDRITTIVGMVELNDRTFDIANVTANTYELLGEDGTSHTAYVSGGLGGAVLSWTNAGGSDASTFTAPNGGFVEFVDPASGITFNDLIAGSQVIVFATGTTTQKFIVESSGTTEIWAGVGDEGTVDFTIMKDDRVIIRTTGVVVGINSLSFNIDQVIDRPYEASTGLTYTTDTTATVGTKIFTLTTTTTVQNFYSFYKEQWRTNTLFRNVQFPIANNGPNSFTFEDDWEFNADSALDNLSRDGVRYLSTAGLLTALWTAIQSLATADVSAFTAEFQKVPGTGTTDALNTGKVDQLVKLFGDAGHGNFDNRDHLVWKYQQNGFREVRVDVVELNDGNDLDDQLFVISMDPVAIAAATGDPGGTPVTITDHLASPVTWNGKQFSITIEDNATTSGTDILRQLNFNLSLDATYNGKDPFNWPEMVIEAGSAYETLRGTTEGAVGVALKGVRVIRNPGEIEHPDFLRFQSNDGTYFVAPTTASINAPNLTAGRIQLVNLTAQTSATWAATTGYLVGARVLRTLGVGPEETAGLYFQVTNVGVSGGSEPAWDTTPGNSTNDGSVVWETKTIQIENETITSGYSRNWIDGTDFEGGDTIQLRWVTSDKLAIEMIGLATTSGTTTFLDTPESDTVYVAYGIDGSTVTEFSADFPNVEIDVNDPDNVFFVDRLYAWNKFILGEDTSPSDNLAIHFFWDALEALSEAEIRIHNAIVDIFLDNVKAVSARQGDQVILSRDDGVYPQAEPTSGGGGLGFYFTGVGFVTETGISGLTASESTQLFTTSSESTLVDVQADVTAILGDTNELQTDWANGGRLDVILDATATQTSVDAQDGETQILENSLSVNDAHRLILAEASGKVAVAGSIVTFRDNADSKDRITATTDTNGQRTAVTTDGT